jgi:glyoxylase I family protein
MAGNKQQQQQAPADAAADIGWRGVHHVGILVQDLDKSRQFYEDVLGLQLNPERPDDRLPYDGAWFWLGPEMIHLMVLPNPDPMKGRPEHGGRDRHMAVGVKSVPALCTRLEEFSIPFTQSKSGRAAVFFRDPDQNVLECMEVEDWR